MVKLVDTQRSGRCGSNPMRVRVPLRALKYMEKFSPFVEQYNKNEVNWRKSVSEISKFIIDHLEKTGFYDFLSNEEIDKDKMTRWQTRLDDLLDKITKRIGYRIDEDKLFLEAYEQINRQYQAGELNPSKGLDYFCSHLEELRERRFSLKEV